MICHVRLVDATEDELRTVWLLLERFNSEVDDRALALLSKLGVRCRRVWLGAGADSRRIIDAIDGDASLAGVPVDAVWAASGSSLDDWLGAQQFRATAGDATLLPRTSPSLFVRLPAIVPITLASARAAAQQLA